MTKYEEKCLYCYFLFVKDFILLRTLTRSKSQKTLVSAQEKIKVKNNNTQRILLIWVVVTVWSILNQKTGFWKETPGKKINCDFC